MATTQQVVLTVTASSSTPLAGAATGVGESAPFTPQLGRDMYLTLTGTWTGTIRIQRSTDGGATWNNITIGGGNPWGVYTGNCDEVVDTPTDGASLYRVSFNVSSGNAAYRLAQ